MVINWHVTLTLESSTKERLRELARRERRTVADYVALLIEKDQKEKLDEPPARRIA